MTARSLLCLGASLLIGVSLLAGIDHAATAQTAPALAAPAATAPAKPKAEADNASVWTLQWENASVSTAKLTDKYYTNGLRLGWTSGPDLVPDTLRNLGNTLWGVGEARMAVDITHQLYNPADTVSGNPPPRDHPFAGVLMANFALVQDTPNTRSSMVLGVGLAGPAAGGEAVQNGFHDLIGQKQVRGWSTQLHNEPLVQITSERTWRVPIGNIGALETDALPDLTASVGNLRVYLQTGATFRLGQGLQSDFGAAMLRPGITGGDYFRRLRDFAWYVFAGLDGRAVGHDLTIDGNTFQNSRGTKHTPFVGEMQAGFAVMAFGVRLVVSDRITTQEFHGQHGGLHQMGSVALSVRF